MYESIARKEMANNLASPSGSSLALMNMGKKIRYDCGRKIYSVGYSEAPARSDASTTCTNYSYIIRNILLKNINRTCVIEKAGARTDDHILRPVALLDIAMRDLQECRSMPFSESERKRYDRTIEKMHAIWKRMYIHMGEEQIYLLNEAMEKMEVHLRNDYMILSNQIHEALRKGFSDDDYLSYCTKLTMIHVCVDLPMKYMRLEFKARFKELEEVSENVNRLNSHFATLDPSTDGDISLDRNAMLKLALEIFQKHFWECRMTQTQAEESAAK